ncbi:MAG: RsmD family RNA methyltransferase, partial [Chlorobi bacterium]|nr:RsmD family RNA methyltransferase [Chlorobiota bacterium]
DAHKTLKRFSENDQDKQFDLIFFDPPYASMISNSIIEVIISENLLNPDGILIAEHSEKESILLPENYELLKSRKFGDTIVDFIGIV